MKHTFPVVKGCQNGNVYYLATMTYGEVATMLKLPEDRYWNSRIFGGGLAMQREMNWKRVKGEMLDYILKSDNAFFSALTLFIIPPTMRPLEEGKDYAFHPSKFQNGTDSPYGLLELQGSLVLFPADGQHRGGAIIEALEHDPELSSQEIPVVLMAFEGEDKVRQFFADLNLYAKSPNRTIGLAFETRDPVAIVGKRVGEIVPLFQGRINVRTNSLSASSDKVIALSTLHAANTELLKALEGDRYGEMLDELRGSAVDAPEVIEVAEQVAEVWQAVIDSLPEWGAVLAGTKHPRAMRDTYVFAHGLGWQAIARAAAAMIELDPDGWEETLRRTLSKIDWTRDNRDWQNVAMSGARVNNTGPGISATAGYILSQAGYRVDGFTPADNPAKSYLDALKRARPELVEEHDLQASR